MIYVLNAAISFLGGLIVFMFLYLINDIRILIEAKDQFVQKRTLLQYVDRAKTIAVALVVLLFLILQFK